MASFKFYFLSALLCGVLILGQTAEILTTPPTVTIDLKTDSPNPETTTPAITTEITTPTTTPTPSTAPTTPPTTTSTTPSTTTPSTTTTSTTTTTTTTTTPPPPTPPTPTPPPAPIGPPDQGVWAYTDNKNTTCIVVQFAATLNVTYPKPNSPTNELLHAIVNVPANASVVSGNCTGAEQWLTIGWPATQDQNNSLTVVFAKNASTNSYEMKSLNATLMAVMMPNLTNVDSVDFYHGKEWETNLATSYRCAAPTVLQMNGDPNNVAAKLTLSRLQEEAFRTVPGKGFSAARDCAGGDIPDAVPIAVGCALGGMVVVVLIAYLVARRRSAARGYLSM